MNLSNRILLLREALITIANTGSGYAPKVAIEALRVDKSPQCDECDGSGIIEYELWHMFTGKVILHAETCGACGGGGHELE